MSVSWKCCRRRSAPLPDGPEDHENFPKRVKHEWGNIVVSDKAFAKEGSEAFGVTSKHHGQLKRLGCQVCDNIDLFKFTEDLKRESINGPFPLIIISQLHPTLADNSSDDPQHDREVYKEMPNLTGLFPSIGFESVVEQAPHTTVAMLQPRCVRPVHSIDTKRIIIRSPIQLWDQDGVYVPERSLDKEFFPMCDEDGVFCTVSTLCPGNIVWQAGSLDLTSMVASAMKVGKVVFLAEHRSKLSKTICCSLSMRSSRHCKVWPLQAHDRVWQFCHLTFNKRVMQGQAYSYADFQQYSKAWQPGWGHLHGAYLWHHATPLHIVNDTCHWTRRKPKEEKEAEEPKEVAKPAETPKEERPAETPKSRQQKPKEA